MYPHKMDGAHLLHPVPPLSPDMYHTFNSDAMSKMNELAAKSNTLTKDLAVRFFFK